MDVKKLQAIIQAVEDTGAAEIEITTSKGVAVRMVRTPGAAHSSTHSEELVAPRLDVKTFESPPDTVVAERSDDHSDNKTDLVSQYIGFFSRFNPRTKKQYCKLRDVVKKGDCVAIIRSMHVDRELISEYEGKITEFLVEEGQPVEYGQPLIRLQPQE